MADPAALLGRLASRLPKKPPPDAPADDGAGAGEDPVRDAMTAFIAAVHEKNPDAAADAFRMAFKALTLEPQLEGADAGPAEEG